MRGWTMKDRNEGIRTAAHTSRPGGGRGARRVRWPSSRMILGPAAILLALTAGPLAAQTHDRITLQQRAAASRARGAESAPVLVLEVADFQCPYCARFWKETFPRLDSAYIRPGKVRWVFVNLPLPTHRHAWSAAEAALCAGALADGFWAAHDRLFERQQEWTALPDPTAAFVSYATELGVPEAEFRACIDGDVVAPLILEDVIFAARSGVRGTPAFFINRDQAVIGLKSFEDWDRMLQEALRRATGGSQP